MFFTCSYYESTIKSSGTQTPAVTTKDSAVQCALLDAPPLLWCKSSDSGGSDTETIESESASEAGADYCDMEDFSDDLEWYGC